MATEVDVVVFYRLQRAPGLHKEKVVLSPIHSRPEKARAQREASQTIEQTWGDLKIVVFCGEDITEADIRYWLSYLRAAQVGSDSDFTLSRYMENAAGEPISDDEDN